MNRNIAPIVTHTTGINWVIIPITNPSVVLIESKKSCQLKIVDVVQSNNGGNINIVTIKIATRIIPIINAVHFFIKTI
jgi:hypothetical protein